MRNLVGKILHLNGEPWAKAKLILCLQNGTYNNTETYPIDVKEKVTNNDGTFSIKVAPNIGLQPSFYKLILPSGETLKFTIPNGTDDIELSTVREAGIVINDPNYNNILQYFNNYINDAVSDLEASTNISEKYIAGENLPALKVVTFDIVTNRVILADSSDTNNFNKIIGITENASNINTEVRVINYGYLEDNSWNWIIGNPIFFDSGGTLIQTPGTAFVQIVAIPVTTTKILVNIQPPIKL